MAFILVVYISLVCLLVEIPSDMAAGEEAHTHVFKCFDVYQTETCKEPLLFDDFPKLLQEQLT